MSLFSLSNTPNASNLQKFQALPPLLGLLLSSEVVCKVPATRSLLRPPPFWFVSEPWLHFCTTSAPRLSMSRLHATGPGTVFHPWSNSTLDHWKNGWLQLFHDLLTLNPNLIFKFGRAALKSWTGCVCPRRFCSLPCCLDLILGFENDAGRKKTKKKNRIQVWPQNLILARARSLFLEKVLWKISS